MSRSYYEDISGIISVDLMDKSWVCKTNSTSATNVGKNFGEGTGYPATQNYKCFVFFPIDSEIKTSDLTEMKIGGIKIGSTFTEEPRSYAYEIYGANSVPVSASYNSIMGILKKFSLKTGVSNKISVSLNPNSVSLHSAIENIGSLLTYNYLVISFEDTGNKQYKHIEKTGLFLSAENKSPNPTVSSINPNNISHYDHRILTVSWKYYCYGAEQKAYSIGWSNDGGKTWHDINKESAATSHAFAGYTFPTGNVRLRIKVTSDEGGTSEYAYSEFNVTKQYPSVRILFPNSVNVPNAMEQIFTWEYDGEDLKQKSYEIGWSSDDGKIWNTKTANTSERYAVFPANTFPTAKIKWRLRVSNTEGNFSEYVYAEFSAAGKSEAPVVAKMSQNAIPTIKWECNDQEAFELKIVCEDEVIYESGMIAGTGTREYRPNIMLKNGIYNVMVRILNIYGIYSDWGSSSSVLNAVAPESTPIIYLKENDKYGVVISGSGCSGEAYVVRKDGENEEIICRYKNKDVVDYRTEPGKKYCYVIRDHVNGYKDSAEAVYECDFSGVMIHEYGNVENCVHIRKSEEDYVLVDNSLSKNTVYKSCIGREYPVRETGKEKAEIFTVSGFLDYENYDALEKLHRKNAIVLLRARNHCCAADISSLRQKRFMNMGYTVEIGLTRIDENTEVKLV